MRYNDDDDNDNNDDVDNDIDDNDHIVGEDEDSDDEFFRETTDVVERGEKSEHLQPGVLHYRFIVHFLPIYKTIMCDVFSGRSRI